MGQIKNIKLHIVTDIKLLSTVRSQQQNKNQQDAAVQGLIASLSRGGEEHPQILKTCSLTKLLLHGRQVPRMLQNHYSLLTRTDRCPLRQLLDCPLSADRWPGPTHRRMQLPKEAQLNPVTCYGIRKEAYLVNLVVVIMLETSHK